MISGLLILSTAIGVVVWYATINILHKDADMIMSLESETEAEKINSMLGDMKQSIQIVSEAAEEELLSVEALLELEYQQTYTGDMEILFNNVARNTDGMIAYYFRYNPELHLPDGGFFYGMTSQSQELQKLPITDLSGDLTGIRWWNEPVAAQKAVWISPYYHSNSDFLTVSYVSPIYKDGQLIGVAGMDIQLTLLLDAVSEIKPYENGYAYLITQTGEKLHHHLDFNYSRGRGQEVVVAKAPLDNGMSLAVCAYSHDIQASGFRMLTAMLLVSCGIVGIFIIMSFVVTRKIVHPLRRLATLTKSLGEIPSLPNKSFDTKDEVGVLYEALDEANHRLYEHMNDVRSRAYRDSLTGLRNFRSYKEATEKMKGKVESGNARFGVVVFDLNNLKVVNDQYGHEWGNELLIRISKMIVAVFRRSKVYRVGGDEFIVILENDDYNDYDKLLASFDAFCAEESFMIEEDYVPLSVAWGVAIYDSEVDSGYENVFHRADGFMYRHKREMKHLDE